MINTTKIEEIRRGLRLSQTDMAHKIWMHVVNYNRIIKGHAIPKRDKLENIVKLHNKWYTENWFTIKPISTISIEHLIKDS